MRLLIFVPQRLIGEAVAASIPGARWAGPGLDKSAVVAWFRETPEAVLVCGTGYVTGWSAPEDTQILFHSSFPDDADRVQATARAR